MTSHSARVEGELRAAGGREQALARDLELAKRAAAALERSPSAAKARAGLAGPPGEPRHAMLLLLLLLPPLPLLLLLPHEHTCCCCWSLCCLASKMLT